MRTFKLLIIAATILLGSNINISAQSAEKIVEKHIAAIGGADNWKKIKTMKLTGSMNAGGLEIPVIITTAQGRGQRVEFTFSGMAGYQIMTTTEGWSYAPFGGQTTPEAITPELVKESQDDLDIQGPLIDYKAKGNTLTLLGKDEVEGTECFKLKVVSPSGKEQTMFIDASNYYHIRTIEKIKANGKEEEHISNYGNYQKLPEGIVYPMSIDDGEGPITIKTVEINIPVDDSIFKLPETKK
jgi:hypothetical protein